jgi:hypothetical protein
MNPIQVEVSMARPSGNIFIATYSVSHDTPVTAATLKLSELGGLTVVVGGGVSAEGLIPLRLREQSTAYSLTTTSSSLRQSVCFAKISQLID